MKKYRISVYGRATLAKYACGYKDSEALSIFGIWRSILNTYYDKQRRGIKKENNDPER